MLTKLELPLEWHEELKTFALSLGLHFLSTAFDKQSLAFLETLNLNLYKIPSGEITNGPLLWAFAKTGKPLILSTGMATLSEVEQALALIHFAWHHSDPPTQIKDIWHFWSDKSDLALLKDNLTLLHCTSQYPTPWFEVNLNAMNTMASAFKLCVGYSDHTLGTSIPIAAVAKGARL